MINTYRRFTFMKDYYTKEEGEKLGFSDGQQPPKSNRTNLLLTKQEFDRIRGIFKYWYDQPDFNRATNGVESTFEETRTKFIKWTYDYLRQFWPKVQYKILEYKKSFELEAKTVYNLKELPVGMYDTIAFKFAKGRPELYLLIGDFTTVMDECRFIAYDEPDGRFVRPNWDL